MNTGTIIPFCLNFSALSTPTMPKIVNAFIHSWQHIQIKCPFTVGEFLKEIEGII
jgi:hypothetical protein